MDVKLEKSPISLFLYRHVEMKMDVKLGRSSISSFLFESDKQIEINYYMELKKAVQVARAHLRTGGIDYGNGLSVGKIKDGDDYVWNVFFGVDNTMTVIESQINYRNTSDVEIVEIILDNWNPDWFFY